MMIDTKEAARLLDVTQTRIQQLLIAGRIPGARKIGSPMRGIWVIEVSDDAPLTVIDGDRRRKKKP
ncbi:hypothetical protein RZS08_06755 [Arthrospira platensis SPKY1]|nr:hypothetical protein [Arthrospira platensis SPKY1]